jgi:hypothetical protein
MEYNEGNPDSQVMGLEFEGSKPQYTGNLQSPVTSKKKKSTFTNCHFYQRQISFNVTPL